MEIKLMVKKINEIELTAQQKQLLNVQFKPISQKENLENFEIQTAHLDKLSLLSNDKHSTVSDTINQSSEYLNNPIKHGIPICQQTIYPSKQFLMLHEICEQFGEFYEIKMINNICKNYNHKAISLNGIGREQNVKIATAHMDAMSATNVSASLLDFLKPKPVTEQPIK